MPTDNIPEQGMLWAYYDVDATHVFKLCMGYVSKISVSYSKSTSIVPIVTKKAKDAFPLDNGATKTYTFNGCRVQPSVTGSIGSGIYLKTKPDSEIAEEQSAWTCDVWFSKAMSLIDRWQMKTDGCYFKIVPSETNPYISIGSNGTIHGYIGSLEITYNKDFNEMLTYYLSVTIGTTHISSEVAVDDPPNMENLEYAMVEGYDDASAPGGRVPSAFITMSTSDRSSTYLIGNLKSNNASAVDSYTIKGGPSEPFEHLDMTCSVSSLTSVAPGLIISNRSVVGSYDKVATDLVDNKNIISIHAVGTSTFVLASHKSTSGSHPKIKIVGYCEAYSYKNARLQVDTLPMAPYDVIDMILSDPKYGPIFTTTRRIMNFDPAERMRDKKIRFEAGQNIWYMLQVCATLLGAKIFFANDKAYIIDYRIPKSHATYPHVMKDSQGNLVEETWSRKEIWTYVGPSATEAAIEVYPQDVLLQNSRNFMYARTISSSFGGGGVDAILEAIEVSCKDGNENNMKSVLFIDPVVERSVSDQNSHDYKSTSFTIPELREAGEGAALVSDFGTPYLEYMREPQTTVKMKVKEERDGAHGKEWRALFSTVSQADSIYDRYHSNYIDNQTMYSDDLASGDSGKRYQKLYLSSYTRYFPDMASEYEWGVINEVDLSNRLASGFQS